MNLPSGTTIGFWRNHPASPGHFHPSRGPGPRLPAVRTCAKGVLLRYVNKSQAIVHYPERRVDVQISTRIIIGRWDEITDQTLFDLRMAQKAKARSAKERKNARDLQFRKQQQLPLT